MPIVYGVLILQPNLLYLLHVMYLQH